NEVSRSGGGAVSTPSGMGAFRYVNGENWAGCAHCGAKHAPPYVTGCVWVCICNRCNGLLHCVGNRGGLSRAACGTLTKIGSGESGGDAIQLQGWRKAHEPRPVP